MHRCTNSTSVHFFGKKQKQRQIVHGNNVKMGIYNGIMPIATYARLFSHLLKNNRRNIIS